jgi:hypothetical protein
VPGTCTVEELMIYNHTHNIFTPRNQRCRTRFATSDGVNDERCQDRCVPENLLCTTEIVTSVRQHSNSPSTLPGTPGSRHKRKLRSLNFGESYSLGHQKAFHRKNDFFNRTRFHLKKMKIQTHPPNVLQPNKRLVSLY